MSEIEVKLLEINLTEIRKKLKEINAILIKKEFQTNYMFDYSDKRLFDNGGYIRIRHCENFLKKEENPKKALITLKKLLSKDKFKISKETEFNVDNFEETKIFFEELGLNLFRIDEKFRESYKLDNGLIEIDTWAGVPTYLEAEAETENDVEILLNKIGYTLEKTTTMTLKELLIHYNLSDENRTFSQEEKNKIINNLINYSHS